MLTRLKAAFLAVSLTALSACGGDSSSSSNGGVTAQATNTAPIANAGVDLTLDISADPVALNGSASRDADGDILSYNWSVEAQPEGVSVSLSNITSSTPIFTSSAPGDYVFKLDVTDTSNASSDDTVTITLTNQPPVISLADHNTAGLVGVPIEFDASGSTDPNDQTLTFIWSIISAPNGSNLTSQRFTDSVQEITFDTDGEFTIELTISDGFETVSQTLPTITIQQIEIAILDKNFSDVEYDSVNDRIVSLFENQITLIEGDGTETNIALPLNGTAVSVSPDGNYVAVAHNAFISYIDLTTKTRIATHSIAADISDIVLDDNGFAHGFPGTGQWVNVHTMNMQTGAVKTSNGGSVRHRTKAKLHPSGTKIYGADNGLYPSDVERYTINADSVTMNYDSPYHGDYPFCGDLWMGPVGDTFLTRCGVIVRTSEVQSTDMTFVSQLAELDGIIEHASSSKFNDLWYVLVDTDEGGSDSIKVIDTDTSSEVMTIALPDTTSGADRKWFGKYVFASNTSNLIRVLAVDDMNDPQNFALISRLATASSSSNLAPSAVTDRYKTSRVATTISLDASQSSDPEGKPLTYEWMLTSEPDGSAVVPIGLTSATVNFTPAASGVYEFSLRVDNGNRQSNIEKVSVNVFEASESLVRRIEGSIADAEYSTSLNALVYLSDTSPDLHILNLTDLTTQKVELDRTPYQLGISPDGNFAAVSFSGFAGLIDLRTATIMKISSYSAAWGDIVLDHNNRAHIAPNRDQHVNFHSIDFAKDTTSQIWGPYAGTQLRMHPTEDWVYGADRGLSPSDFEKWDVTNMPVSYLRDSPYHGDYAISGNIWISEDGDKLLAAGGNFFNASSDPDKDMTYSGTLSDSARLIWAEHSAETNEWAVITDSTDNTGEVAVYSDDFYVRGRSIPTADIQITSGLVSSQPNKLFYSESGDTLYVLIKADGLSDSFAVQIIED